MKTYIVYGISVLVVLVVLVFGFSMRRENFYDECMKTCGDDLYNCRDICTSNHIKDTAFYAVRTHSNCILQCDGEKADIRRHQRCMRECTK